MSEYKILWCGDRRLRVFGHLGPSEAFTSICQTVWRHIPAICNLRNNQNLQLHCHKCVYTPKTPTFWYRDVTFSNLLFFVALRRNADHDLLIFEVSRSHIQRRTSVGRTPLNEWSARRRDLYLTIHNTHNKYPCPRWNSNPRSQQAIGHRLTP
jgi:hypothetical protein